MPNVRFSKPLFPKLMAKLHLLLAGGSELQTLTSSHKDDLHYLIVARSYMGMQALRCSK